MYAPIGGDNTFLFDLYARYRRDRYSVPADWLVYFDQLETEGQVPAVASATRAKSTPSAAQGSATSLLNAYRRYGHIEADLDPLRPKSFTASTPKRAERLGRAER